MVWLLTLDLALAAAFMLGWYFWFAARNRKRCLQVLRWIDAAFTRHGQISGVHWSGPSRFHVDIRTPANSYPAVFHRVSLLVQLIPRETPIAWLMSWWKKRRETFTFQANLDYAPRFTLQVQNHRWCGRTRRDLPADPDRWLMDSAGPFVITTRPDWDREVSTLMNALSALRECDCVEVSFQKTAPHFSATVPLASISPESNSDTDIVSVLRELAMGSSAKNSF